MDANNPFTPASRQEWVRRCQRCYDYLKACEKFLGQMEELAGMFPIYQQQADWAKEQKEEIHRSRMTIKEQAKRRGV